MVTYNRIRNRPGYVLKPSPTNPRVRRWQKVGGRGYIDFDAGPLARFKSLLDPTAPDYVAKDPKRYGVEGGNERLADMLREAQEAYLRSRTYAWQQWNYLDSAFAEFFRNYPDTVYHDSPTGRFMREYLLRAAKHGVLDGGTAELVQALAERGFFRTREYVLGQNPGLSFMTEFLRAARGDEPLDEWWEGLEALREHWEGDDLLQGLFEEAVERLANRSRSDGGIINDENYPAKTAPVREGLTFVKAARQGVLPISDDEVRDLLASGRVTEALERDPALLQHLYRYAYDLARGAKLRASALVDPADLSEEERRLYARILGRYLEGFAHPRLLVYDSLTNEGAMDWISTGEYLYRKYGYNEIAEALGQPDYDHRLFREDEMGVGRVNYAVHGFEVAPVLYVLKGGVPWMEAEGLLTGASLPMGNEPYGGYNPVLSVWAPHRAYSITLDDTYYSDVTPEALWQADLLTSFSHVAKLYRGVDFSKAYSFYLSDSPNFFTEAQIDGPLVDLRTLYFFYHTPVNIQEYIDDDLIPSDVSIVAVPSYDLHSARKVGQFGLTSLVHLDDLDMARRAVDEAALVEEETGRTVRVYVPSYLAEGLDSAYLWTPDDIIAARS